MPRWLFGTMLLLVGWAARGEIPADAGAAFRLEGKAAIDDVFGDTSDYRRTIDRFLELTATMQSMRDDFARAVQQVLGEVTARSDGRSHARACPIETVA